MSRSRARPKVVLPEPGLADHRQGLAGAQLQRQAVHGLDVIDRAPEHALLDREPDLDVVGLEHDRRTGPRLGRASLGLGGHQMARVGMLRPLEHIGRLALLDDLAGVHDIHAIRHVPHDAKIVRDEQHGHAALPLQRLEQIENLRLDGDVERSGRLVGDQQVRLVGQRHGDHHALALSAGELMGIGVEPLLGLCQTDLAQQLQHALAHGGLVETVMQLHDLADLLADGVQRD